MDFRNALRRFVPALSAALALAATALFAVVTPAGAQTPDTTAADASPPPPAAPKPPPPAAPADVESIDAIVGALYDVISGPAGTRDWERFRSLFAPGARLIPSVRDSTGGTTAAMLGVEDYIRLGDEYFRAQGFFEREIARRTDTFGSVADLWSVYESRHAAADAEPFQRGINSIQLLKDKDRWWVVGIFWDAERPDNPIPEKYLPATGSGESSGPDGTPGAAADTTSR